MKQYINRQPGKKQWIRILALMLLQFFMAGNISAQSPVITAKDVSGHALDGTLFGFALTGSSSNWVTGRASGICSPFSAPTVTITASGPLQLCPNGSVTLTASGPAASYLWSPGGQTTPSIDVSTAGSYTVTTTNAQGCSATSAAKVITVNPPSTATLISSNNPHAVLCLGYPAQIVYRVISPDPTAFATVSIPGYTSSTTNQNIITITANGGAPTVIGRVNFSIVVVGVCAEIINSYFDVFPAPVVSITPNGPLTICPGGSVLLSANLINGYSYQWYKNSAIIANATSNTFLATEAGSYNVQVSLGDYGLCSGSTYPPTVVTMGGPSSISLTSASTTNSQTVCLNRPIENILYSTTGSTGATFTGLPAGVTGSWAANVATISGSPTITGNFNYTVTVDGGCGTASATSSISVNDKPVITCPGDQTANTALNACDAMIEYSVNVQSVPAADITYEFSGATTGFGEGTGSGSTFNKGITTVTISAKNPCGTSYCSFTVTVNDNQLPVITCPADITTVNDPTKNGAIVNYSNTGIVGFYSLADDISIKNLSSFDYSTVSSTPIIVNDPMYIPVPGNQNINGLSMDPTTGTNYVVLTPNRSSPMDRFLAKINLNTGNATIIGNLHHAIASIAFAADGTLYGVAGNADPCYNCLLAIDKSDAAATSVMNLTISGNGRALAYNNDDGMLYFWTSTSMSKIDLTTNVQTIISEDIGQGISGPSAATYLGGGKFHLMTNNPSMGVFTADVNGTHARVGTMDHNSRGVLKAVYEQIHATDNCSDLINVQTKGLPSGSFFPLGTTTNSFVVSDAGGNTVTCSFNVTVNDNEPPLISCHENIIQFNDPDQQGAIVNYGLANFNTDSLYAIWGGLLRKFNGEDGSIISDVPVTVAGLTGELNLQSIALDPTSGLVYVGIAVDNDYTNIQLATVDLSNGAASIIGNTTHGIAAMAFDLTGNLFAMADGNDVCTDCMYQIDKHTAQATSVMNLMNSNGTALAFNFDDHMLYVGNNLTLSKIDLATFTETVVNSHVNLMSIHGNNLGHMIYIGDGKFYVTDQRDGNFGIVDVNGIGVQGFHDLSFPHPQGFLIAGFASIHASDNSGHFTITQTGGLPSGSFFPMGTTTNTFEVTDPSGNMSTCSFTITINNSCIPAAFTSCPETITQSTDPNACTAVVTYDPGVTGTPAPAVSYIFSGATTGSGTGTGSGETFNKGITTVTITAENACHTAVCSFDITIEDNERPAITCPPNKVINCQDDNTSSSTGTATATDNCSPNADIAISQSDVSTQTATGSGHYNYTITRTWKATDRAGNFSTCVQTIIVRDVTRPVITCPVNITVNNDPGVCGAAVIFAATATDNCSPVAITYSIASGSMFDIGTTNVTATATDRTGNSISCSFTVTVNDVEKPVLHNVPANVTAECDAVPEVYGEITATDNCPDVSEVSFTETRTDGNCPFNYTLTRVWSATDAHGNTTTATQIVTIRDTRLPSFSERPTHVVVSCDNIPEPPEMRAGNECSEAVVTFNQTSDQDPDQNSIGHYSYSITRTWMAVDACGNSNTYTQLITVHDNSEPVITCPGDITVNCQDDNSSQATGFATATDNCSPVNVEENQTSTQVADPNDAGHYNYVITRTWKANDVSGNASECVQTITVRDVTAPVITCPDNVALSCQDDNSSNATGVATGTDNCSPVTISQSDVSTQTVTGAGHYNYSITRTWKATDVTGNHSECVQTIAVRDLIAPVITCPGDLTINCQDDNSSNATGVATAMDNCSAVTITQSQTSTQTASGSGHYNYMITRTWKASDESGHNSECVQTITVQDVTAPAITCPADKVLNCQDNNSSASTGVASVTDNCSDVSISQSQTSTQTATGAGHYNYVITRTWRAADESGNSSTCDQTITVRDVTAPAISCPADVTVSCQEGNSSNSTGVATALDNCSAVTITQSQTSTQTASGSGQYNYLITRTWNATDESGNSSTCDQTITVRDVTAPAITCPANVTVNCHDDHSSNSTGVATALDNCSAVTITQTQTSTQTATGSGHYNYVITRTWKATDESGNFSECVQTINVQDVTAPVITCPANKTLNCQDNNTSASTGIATASDNCSVVTITQSQTSTQTASGAGQYNYVITRTWRATDESGNNSECVQLITVHDVTAPTAICKPVTVTLVGGSATITPANVDNGSTDNCGPVTLSLSKTSFSCSNVGNNTVTLTVTDVSGNSSTCTAVITVLGSGPTCSITAVPSSTVFTGGIATNLYLGYGPDKDTLKVSVPASGAPYTYAWSGGTLSNYNTANPVFTATTAGSYTFTVAVTNKYGCTTTCSISICVTDIRVAGTSGNSLKVYLCHLPTGNPGNAQTLSISASAVPAHLSGHTGDRLGRCDLTPCTVAPGFARTTIEKPVVIPPLDGLIIKVMPNPTTNYFLVSIESSDNAPVSIRVANGVGQLIEMDRSVKPGSIIQIGEKYIGGTYYLQAMQGTLKTTVKMVKLN